MNKTLLLLFLIVISTYSVKAQWYQQYFDGDDTLAYNSIFIEIDTNRSNSWQIGPPQKTLINSAASFPNCLITDTLNPYPINDSSEVGYSIGTNYYFWGILAIQFIQKIDFESGKDFGILEFSVDSGNTWNNAFGNPYVYNFYGFNWNNVDTMPDGTIGFTGTDTTWRNIWFCFDYSWLGFNDTLIHVRHRILSDSINTNHEGWAIDNLIASITFVHTLSEDEQSDYLNVYPNPTQGRINISTKKLNQLHVIESINLLDQNGRTMQSWGVSPTKFFVDIGHHPPGVYFLKIKTNIKTEIFKVILED